MKVSTALALAGATCLPFWLHVERAWNLVFTPDGVNFQEPDAWFHMRAIHNLLAHFPWRSGFDPYAFYPGGARAVTDAWDYMVASIAWLAGGGAPSEVLVDEVGAWLPALLGALFPAAIFFLARRLFGLMAGILGAFWIAMMPGTFLWVSRLGMPDHHAAEALAGFMTLSILCGAAERQGRRRTAGAQRWLGATLGGIVLGVYLDVRPAGLFVPAILTVSALLWPELAPVVAVAIAAACVAFIPANGNPGSKYTWLALMVCLAAASLLAVLNRIGEKRNWSRLVRYGAIGVSAAAPILCVCLFFRREAGALIGTIESFLPDPAGRQIYGNIKELRPLWLAAPGGFASLFYQFGAAWVLAIPGLAAAFLSVWRDGRASLGLFTVWALTMILAVLFQLRMAVYAGPVVAILAGLTASRIMEWIPVRVMWLRGIAGTAMLLLGFAVALPGGIDQTAANGGPDPDWRAALTWLRWKTPEPMGDPAAWYRWYPELGASRQFTWPKSAYSIVTPWDKGWLIAGMARRLPASNGAQAGALQTARFLTETQPSEAAWEVRATGAGYVVIGPGEITVEVPALVKEAERRVSDYSRLLYVHMQGEPDAPLRVWLPAYFQSMSTRLYTFDGRRTLSSGASVFVTETGRSPEGEERETILAVHQFASEGEARAWMASNSFEKSFLASPDPIESCVDLEEVPWLARVFASNNDPMQGNRQPTAVKIFRVKNTEPRPGVTGGAMQ